MEPPAPPPSPETVSKLTWWQVLVLYPAIASAVLGAIPTAWQALKAWRLNVNYDKVQQAAEQQRLWERNLDCLEAKPVYSVEGPSGAVIGVTLCPSGDALLRYDSGEQVTYTWIPYPVRRPLRSRGLPPKAAAGSAGPAIVQAEPATPLLRSNIVWGATRCAFRHGTVVIRLYTTDGAVCWVEHVLVATGEVISQVPVACSVSCAEVRVR